jgi:hypothetical protein
MHLARIVLCAEIYEYLLQNRSYGGTVRTDAVTLCLGIGFFLVKVSRYCNVNAKAELVFCLNPYNMSCSTSI